MIGFSNLFDLCWGWVFYGGLGIVVVIVFVVVVSMLVVNFIG